MKPGIYEDLINQEKECELNQAEQNNLTGKKDKIDGAEISKMLADYLSDIIVKRIEEEKDDNSKEQLRKRIDFANELLSKIGVSDEKTIIDKENYLSEIITKQEETIRAATKNEVNRPLSGFRASSLFTGGMSELSLESEINRDIESADRIYIIVSFLRMSGLNLIKQALKKFCEVPGHKLKVITTTYCGITEAKAVEQLASLPNTEICISYNTSIERLHAKAYIFERNSGYSTAYIGSSNLSAAAQTSGLEWNIRVTNIENKHIIDGAIATFNRYWQSPDFEDFSIGGIEKFNSEKAKENSKRYNEKTDYSILQVYNVLPHQKEILDKLLVERSQGINRNLVVAATGTGKTVISAFDYQCFKNHNPNRNRLLFIVHREEILKQAQHTFRSVLGDNNFGELWVGNNEPRNGLNHLFVSVQTANSRLQTFKSLGEDYYDFVIFDEAHHIEASSYQTLVQFFKPKVLLGLTATPERMDGKSLLPDFCNRISAEIRLPKALEAGLLTPFHYFCISDETDLTSDSLWSGGKYIGSKITELLNTTQRVKLVINSLNKYLSDETSCKALGFCATKEHAAYMAMQFNANGLKADYLTSDRDKDRESIRKSLEEGKINYLFVVDMFNEGVDIPAVDTILFLRPTESLTIFQQQLGRGLRLYQGKSVLTVLDFVAQAHKKYNYSDKFKSLMKRNDADIKKQIENGFTMLPPGCSILMEEVAQREILNHINNAIYDKRRLVKELSLITGDILLKDFLNRIGQDLRVIYKSHNCWSLLKREAGKLSYNQDEWTKLFEKRMGNFYYVNSIMYISFIKDFLDNDCSCANCSAEQKPFKVMLYYALFEKKISDYGFDSLDQAFDVFKKYPVFVSELKEIIEYRYINLEVQTEPLYKTCTAASNLPSCIEQYGCYSREDVFALFGVQTEKKRMQGSVTGVFNIEGLNTEVFFVTLNKSDKEFSPTTMFNDYVISERRFHWQSQNADTHDGKGSRYVNQKLNGKRFVLFVRESKKDGFGNTCPFYCFGLINYIQSSGDSPMNIEWETEKAILPQFIRTA